MRCFFLLLFIVPLILKGQGTDEPEKLNKSTILGAKILYKPARNFKKLLQNLSYKRLR